MPRSRITDHDVNVAHRAFTSALSARYAGMGEVKVDLHIGNAEYKVTNKLIVHLPRKGSGSTRSQQVWPDGMAGYGKRDAYNALRLMNSGLSLALEADEMRDREGE